MPKFLKKPENVECLEFDDIKFETTVSGKPEPTVEWYSQFLYAYGRFTNIHLTLILLLNFLKKVIIIIYTKISV